MEREELVGICMEMISFSGEGRSKVHEARVEFSKKNYENVRSLLEEAEELLGEAHKAQFSKLMVPQNQGQTIPFDLLLLHAMDLLMVATSEYDILKIELRLEDK